MPILKKEDLISPGSILILEKVDQFQRIGSDALKVMDKNLLGEVPKDPFPDLSREG